MIKRLLFSGGILGVLIGCGGITAAAPVTTAHAAVRPVDAAGRGHIASARTGSVALDESQAPASSPKAAASGLPPVATAASAPQPQHNLLTGPHGLNAPVGPTYTDCTGNSEVPHRTAAVDACFTAATLFVGHNEGLFTPLLSFVRGDVINWYDSGGAVHRLRIVAVRDVSSAVFPPALAPYEFQTCLYSMLNSPLNRILDAVEI